MPSDKNHEAWANGRVTADTLSGLRIKSLLTSRRELVGGWSEVRRVVVSCDLTKIYRGYDERWNERGGYDPKEIAFSNPQRFRWLPCTPLLAREKSTPYLPPL